MVSIECGWFKNDYKRFGRLRQLGLDRLQQVVAQKQTAQGLLHAATPEWINIMKESRNTLTFQ